MTTQPADFIGLLAKLHLPTGNVEATLDSIVEFACDALHTELGGVMLAHRDGSVVSAAVSDQLVSRGDELQMLVREGPSLSAMDEGHVELVRRTVDDRRWRAWGPAAHQIGIRSVLSVRLARTATDPIGSLNVYNLRTDGFSADAIETARIIARHASMALVAGRKARAIERALETRASIGHAEGIVMTRYGIDADQASNMLRRDSQAYNVPLRDVARMIVHNRGQAVTTQERP